MQYLSAAGLARAVRWFQRFNTRVTGSEGERQAEGVDRLVYRLTF